MRLLLTTFLFGVAMASSVFGADDERATTLTPAVASVANSVAQRDLASMINRVAEFKQPHRPPVLPAFYASSIALQGYDAYSTLTALKSGASEANPLMKGITRSPLAFIAVKAGLTTASIVGAERLWKDHHRVAAVVMMVGSNSVMTAVAVHNASVLQRIR